MIVSGGDEVRVFAPPKREPQEQIRLEGAGALCVSHGTVFCASAVRSQTASSSWTVGTSSRRAHRKR